MWNERIQLGPLTTSAAPQMLLEVFAEKMGKGELLRGAADCRLYAGQQGCACRFLAQCYTGQEAHHASQGMPSKAAVTFRLPQTS